MGSSIQDKFSIKRRKVSEEVRDSLVEMIRAGDLVAGERLPAERDLAERFGVSRTTLRDALRELELLGYVNVKQGNGSTVRQPDASTLALPFRTALLTTPYLASELIEFRQLLEPQLAALAAARRSESQVTLLQASINKQAALLASGERLADEDIAFHDLVAACAGNTTILRTLSLLQSLLFDLRARLLTGDQPQLTLDQHRAIAQAIIQQQEEVAYDAMVEHLLAVKASIVSPSADTPF